MTENVPPDGPIEGGLGEDIFGTEIYEAALPAKREFLPWHRPRKHFVRTHQWCTEIASVLDGSQRDDGVVRYLGLPGADLLDLRCFHSELCEPRDLRLRFLGFNSAARPDGSEQTDLNVSLDEVRKLKCIDPASDVIWDDFGKLGNQNSVAWKRARDLGPYDVINLDLCDGFGAQPPDALAATHYNAVNSLLSLQARTKHPWLLLLTTRVGRAFVHDDVLQPMLDRYDTNLAECASFRRASTECFSVGNAAQLRTAAADPLGMLQLFLVGISKWLISLTTAQQPPSKVEVRSAIGYRVHAAAACADLMSLAIKIEPTFAPVGDRMSLARRTSRAPDECTLATRALRRLATHKNADEILAGDGPLRAQMVDGTAALLGAARYDIHAYHEWLQEHS